VDGLVFHTAGSDQRRLNRALSELVLSSCVTSRLLGAERVATCLRTYTKLVACLPATYAERGTAVRVAAPLYTCLGGLCRSSGSFFTRWEEAARWRARACRHRTAFTATQTRGVPRAAARRACGRAAHCHWRAPRAALRFAYWAGQKK